MLYAGLGVFAVIVIFGVITIIFYNKFRLAIIKIDEAENNIDILFEKKIQLLERARTIIKKELKLKEFLEDIDFLSESSINHFEMNNSLKNIHCELNKTLDAHDKLFKSEALLSVIEEIRASEEEILGSTKFYNDNVVIFNQLIDSFPSNLVAIIFRYKRKEFYNNEKKEMYEILNDK